MYLKNGFTLRERMSDLVVCICMMKEALMGFEVLKWYFNEMVLSSWFCLFRRIKMLLRKFSGEFLRFRRRTDQITLC